jgi:hypothetical protein
MSVVTDFPGLGDAVLIAAHPGHELHLFHWMERVRPLVFLLTDGSGGAAASRTDYSARCCAAAGAEPGGVFGMLPDRAWYAALLAGDAVPFQAAAEAIASESARRRPSLLVSDAVDGYNPMHDLAAAVAAGVAARLLVPHLVYPVTGGASGEPAVSLPLDAAARQRKRAAALAYAPLADEARALLAADGAWTIERLLRPEFAWPSEWLPQYEKVGRERIAAGRYEVAITYREHVLPVARRLLPG